jgi:lysylphosphatidylglycerol synthetase-like protein (DUF2156 family)
MVVVLVVWRGVWVT